MSAIFLLPMGEAERGLTEMLLQPIQNVFQVETAVMNTAVNMRSFYDEQRNQYNSTSMLQFAKENLTNSYLRSVRRHHTKAYLLVTGEDLFIPILTYVFGEAELNGDVAVVSHHRLQNERYGLPPNPALLNERLRKEAIHELGHTYGLVHCRSPQCVMHTSTYVEDIDLKGESFCDPCKKIVEHTTAKRR